VSVGSFAEVWGWSRSGTISTKSMGLGAAVVQGRSFKGRQVTGEVIPWAVRWYLMLPISYRDLKLMLLNCAFRLTHDALRWIQAYTTELQKRIQPHLRRTTAPCGWTKPIFG
jgi:hypothetical protein